jgi:hypothetical protein
MNENTYLEDKDLFEKRFPNRIAVDDISGVKGVLPYGTDKKVVSIV